MDEQHTGAEETDNSTGGDGAGHAREEADATEGGSGPPPLAPSAARALFKEDQFSFVGSTVTIVATLFPDPDGHERGRRVLIQAFNASGPPVFCSYRAADLTAHAPLDNLQEGFRAVLLGLLEQLAARKGEHDAAQARKGPASQEHKKKQRSEPGSSAASGQHGAAPGSLQPPLFGQARPSAEVQATN